MTSDAATGLFDAREIAPPTMGDPSAAPACSGRTSGPEDVSLIDQTSHHPWGQAVESGRSLTQRHESPATKGDAVACLEANLVAPVAIANLRDLRLRKHLGARSEVDLLHDAKIDTVGARTRHDSNRHPVARVADD